MEFEEIDLDNVDEMISFIIQNEKELEKLTLEQIQVEINLIERFLDILQPQKVELQQEIEVYEEEKLQEISSITKKVSNYLDRLYDFESFAENSAIWGGSFSPPLFL